MPPYTPAPIPGPKPGFIPEPIPAPPAPDASVPAAAVPSFQQLSGMLNGLIGNMGNVGSVFENNNWWLWAAAIIILINPDLRNKLLGKGKEEEKGPKTTEADQNI